MGMLSDRTRDLLRWCVHEVEVYESGETPAQITMQCAFGRAPHAGRVARARASDAGEPQSRTWRGHNRIAAETDRIDMRGTARGSCSQDYYGESVRWSPDALQADRN